MSADNGIYILQTPRDLLKSDHIPSSEECFEYRVKYLMGVDGYRWDEEEDNYVDDPDVWIENARDMWKNCEIFTSRPLALSEADKIYTEFMKDGYANLEYGISYIYIPRFFERKG